MRTDDICDRYYDKKVGLVLRLLEDPDGDPPSIVLIQGSADALRMVAELLIAVAEERENDGFSISPFGGGYGHFSPASELGLYIHRIDKESGSVPDPPTDSTPGDATRDSGTASV